MRPSLASGRFSALVLIAFVSLLTIFGSTTAEAAKGASTSGGCLPGAIKAKLNEIRSKFGPVTIVSTFRRGARIAGTGHMSYHASCRAVDFHPPKGKYSAVLAYLQKTHSGGLGTYSCGMHHLHLDNGPRVRFHHCVSASGRPLGKKYAGKKRHRNKTYALRQVKGQAFVAQGQGKKARKKRKRKA